MSWPNKYWETTNKLSSLKRSRLSSGIADSSIHCPRKGRRVRKTQTTMIDRIWNSIANILEGIFNPSQAVRKDINMKDQLRQLQILLACCLKPSLILSLAFWRLVFWSLLLTRVFPWMTWRGYFTSLSETPDRLGWVYVLFLLTVGGHSADLPPFCSSLSFKVSFSCKLA